MKDREILDRLEPIIKEFYGDFILVGFNAETGKVGCIGKQGRIGSRNRKKLRHVKWEIEKLIQKENEKNT